MIVACDQCDRGESMSSHPLPCLFGVANSVFGLSANIDAAVKERDAGRGMAHDLFFLGM